MSGGRPLVLAAHGTHRRFNQGCRCLPCREAELARKRRTHKLRQLGQPLRVDAGEAAARLARWRAAGHTRATMSAHTGVSLNAIYKILTGRNRMILRETATRILAAPEIAATPRGPVSALGTRRRIQALRAMGWPVAALGREADYSPWMMFKILSGAVDRLDAANAARIAAMYERLWDVDPLAHGVRPSSVTLVRGLARQDGAAPPAAWDEDMDDPGARPDWGGCGTENGYNSHRRRREKVCEACGVAYRAYKRKLHAQGKKESA